MSSEFPETDVVKAALAGDPAAFEVLIGKYARLVYAQVYVILHDHEGSRDVVQQAFLKAYRFRIRLRDPSKFKPWLLSIARNLAKDALRKSCRRESATTDPGYPGPAPASPAPEWRLDMAERLNSLLLALAALPEHHRQAITLRYLQGLGHQAIQEEMGLSNGALRGILGRALAGLRTQLQRGGIRHWFRTPELPRD